MSQLHAVSYCCKQRLLQAKQHNWLRGTSQKVTPYSSIAGSEATELQDCRQSTCGALFPDRQGKARQGLQIDSVFYGHLIFLKLLTQPFSCFTEGSLHLAIAIKVCLCGIPVLTRC